MNMIMNLLNFCIITIMLFVELLHYNHITVLYADMNFIYKAK